MSIENFDWILNTEYVGFWKWTKYEYRIQLFSSYYSNIQIVLIIRTNTALSALPPLRHWTNQNQLSGMIDQSAASSLLLLITQSDEWIIGFPYGAIIYTETFPEKKIYFPSLWKSLYCTKQTLDNEKQSDLKNTKDRYKIQFKLRDVINAMNSEVTDETLIDINLTEEENLVEIFEQMEKCKSSESDLSNNHIIFHSNISPNRLHHARI